MKKLGKFYEQLFFENFHIILKVKNLDQYAYLPTKGCRIILVLKNIT